MSRCLFCRIFLTLAASLLVSHLLTGCHQEAGNPPEVQSMEVPAGPGSATPNLAVSPDGSVILSWLDTLTEGHALRFAVLGGSGWGPSRTVAQGSGWLANWADFPSVVPLSESFWAAHWLRKNADSPYAYDVLVSVSEDAGVNWHDPVMPHNDGTATEHGFVSLYPAMSADQQNTRAGILWLDGRNMTADGGVMTLRAAVVGAAADGGDTILEQQLVDDRVCDCCQTDLAIGSSGPIAVFRNRTADEVRDIHVSRFTRGAWDEGQSVADDGWVITGCPVNGPAIAAAGDQVAVAWYTGSGNQPAIRLAFSRDSATSFEPSFVIATGAIMGRVDVVLLDGGEAVVSWVENARTENGDAVAEIRARRVSPAGQQSASFLAAQTGVGRPSGFPQMVRDRAQLIFAWTDTRGQTPQVRSARVALSALP